MFITVTRTRTNQMILVNTYRVSFVDFENGKVVINFNGCLESISIKETMEEVHSMIEQQRDIESKSKQQNKQSK